MREKPKGLVGHTPDLSAREAGCSIEKHLSQIEVLFYTHRKILLQYTLNEYVGPSRYTMYYVRLMNAYVVRSSSIFLFFTAINVSNHYIKSSSIMVWVFSKYCSIINSFQTPDFFTGSKHNSFIDMLLIF